MLSWTAMSPFGASVSSRAAGSTTAVRVASSAMLLASLALGCAASDADQPESPAPTDSIPPATESDPAPPPAGVYPGTYFVPVPPELEAYALFELESVRVEQRGDELRLQYDLPELLLGEPRGLSFRGGAAEAGSYRLEGDDGVATCRRSAGQLRCDEVLNRIELDARKIDRLLEPMSEVEARARRTVADRFSIDPIGVLELELSPEP